MKRQLKYRYVLYDEQGIYLDIVYGPNVKSVIEYLRKIGWTSANAAGVSNWFKGTLKSGQRVGRVYGRDRSEKIKEQQFRHITYIREKWAEEMEFADLTRKDFIS